MSWYVLQERMPTCHVHNALFNSRKKYNGTIKSMDQERDQCLQRRRERERALEIAEKKEDWLRMPNVLQLLRLQIYICRPRGPADSCCQGPERPDSSL